MLIILLTTLAKGGTISMRPVMIPAFLTVFLEEFPLKSRRKSRTWRSMFRLPNNKKAKVFSRINSCFILLVLGCSCRADKLKVVEQGNYPPEVAIIVQRNCSVTGCHTTLSKGATGGISMETWDELLQGGNNGNAYVVPFSPDQSPFLYIINEFAELGPSLEPRMPYNLPSFSKERVQLLSDWILAGAPSATGEIKFSDYQNQSMIYILNSKCGKIAVIEEESGLVIRYADINDSGGGFAEIISVAPDGDHFYVVHALTGVMKKYSVSNNQKVSELNLGVGVWRSMTISPDSKTAIVANWSGNSFYSGGDIKVIDLDMMSTITTYDDLSDSLYFPFGLKSNQDFTKLYCSCSRGNFIYEIDITDILNPLVSKEVISPPDAISFTSAVYQPGFIELKDDESEYFVVCEGSDELRVFDALTHSLISTHSVGNVPQEVIVSEAYNIYAVSCMEDVTSFATGKGSIVLFDLTTHTEITRIYSGYQPRGLILNQAENYLYVINRNADPVGADVPHHYSGCEGNNGYVTIIDLNTMELLEDYKAELNVDPYAVDIKF